MVNMKTQLLIITALESELKPSALPPGLNIVYSGIGKINAALMTAKAIHQFNPSKIINFGTVGKINPQLDALVDIGKVIQRDMMAEPLAPRGQIPFCKQPSEYLSSGEYVCGSGDSFVTGTDPWLLSQGVDVVDMELFAIAFVANQHQIPWYAYKFISDDANDSSGDVWREKVNHGEELFLNQLKQILS